VVDCNYPPDQERATSKGLVVQRENDLMIKLPFIPDFFPVLMLPLYWVYFLCFYLWYLPVLLIVRLFTPYRSKEAAYAYYMKKHSEDQRSLEYSPDTNKEEA
jgi:hypothetical protein